MKTMRYFKKFKLIKVYLFSFLMIAPFSSLGLEKNALGNNSGPDTGKGWIAYVNHSLAQIAKNKISANTEKLFEAILSGNTEEALRLIGEGVNTRAVNSEGKSLLHIASETENIKLIETFFDIGEKALLELRDKNGRTALHLASFRGHSPVIKSLLENGADIQAKDKWGNSPAHDTVIKEKISALELLLSYGADINATNNKNQTPLHLAVVKNKKYLTRFLIEKGADPNIKDKRGNISLHIAVYGKDTDILNAILSSDIIKLDLLNDMGLTALHIAMDAKNKDMITALIKKGANPNIKNRLEEAILHAAVYYGGIDILNAILSSDIIKPDVLNRDNNTPLHFAVGLGKSNMVEALIKKGADPNIKNNDGETAIDVANRKSDKRILEMLSSACKDSFDL